MISAPNRPICSARYALNMELAPLSFCRSATPKPCSFISTRSPQESPPAHTPSLSSIRPAGTAPRTSGFPAIYRSCHCRRVRQNSTPRKHLAVHAPELAVEPYLQILRRHRRSLLLRMEHTDRSALENHVHRTPRLGGRRSLNLRIGISIGQRGALSVGATPVQGRYAPTVCRQRQKDLSEHRVSEPDAPGHQR